MANIEWFDDLTVGMTFKSREVEITESDIKRFAAEFDPQPMHMDAVAARIWLAYCGRRHEAWG